LPSIGIAWRNEALRQTGGTKASDASDALFAWQRRQLGTPAGPAVCAAEKLAAADRATRLGWIDIDISHAGA